MTHRAFYTSDVKRPMLFSTSPVDGKPVETPVTSYSRSEPLTRPTLWAEATLPSALWATGASVAALSATKFLNIGLAVMNQQEPTATYGLEYWAAILAGSIAYMRLFRWRLEEYDQIKMRHEEYQAEPPMDKPTQPPVRPIVTSPNNRQVKIGKFSLTRDEWKAVAHTIFHNDGRVIRDVLAQAKTNPHSRVFSNITKDWPNISAEFDRMGWSKNGSLTADGEAWLKQFIPLP